MKTKFLSVYQFISLSVEEKAMNNFDELLRRSPILWDGMITIETNSLLRANAQIIELILPKWEDKNPKDKVPTRTFDLARDCIEALDEDQETYLRILLKGCAKSRKRKLGYEHRVVDAIREFAKAVLAAKDKVRREYSLESLTEAEDEIVYRYAIDSIYGKEEEIRRQFLSIIQANDRG